MIGSVLWGMLKYSEPTFDQLLRILIIIYSVLIIQMTTNLTRVFLNVHHFNLSTDLQSVLLVIVNFDNPFC